ncbi:MAG: SAM-dependent methyltransferase [Limnothrix sp.]
MQLKEVVPWGRTLAEYRAMFDLSDFDLHKNILGCGDGPASFNAEMTEAGHTVISIDPVYQFSAAQIRERVEAVYEPIISQVKQQPEKYMWTNFRDADELGQARLAAMETFLEDYADNENADHYQNQALPKLNFRNQQFEICLCSHLLFLYSQQLSLEFHLQSVQELLRVAAEVRIFPLIDLDGTPSPYLDEIRQTLTDQGYSVTIQTVAYEFQKGGNQMLKILTQREFGVSKD